MGIVKESKLHSPYIISDRRDDLEAEEGSFSFFRKGAKREKFYDDRGSFSFLSSSKVGYRFVFNREGV